MASGLPPPPPSSSSFSAATGKINYIRLSTLIIDVGRRALRDVFDAIHPPSTLNAVLCSVPVHSTLQSLKYSKRLYIQQWNTLYPGSGGSTSSANFDVALLSLLLRNICSLAPPRTGWGPPPLPSDQSKQADLVRIKRYRNELAHAIDLTLSDTEFETSWNDIKAVLIRLGGSKYEAEIERLKVDSIDAECENNLKVLLQSCEEGDEKILDAVRRQDHNVSVRLQSQEERQEKVLDAMGRQEQTSRDILQSQEEGQEKILDAMGRQEQTSSVLLQSQEKGVEKILDAVGRQEQKVDSWEINVKGLVKVVIGGMALSWAAGSAFFLNRYSDDPEMVIRLVQDAIIPAGWRIFAGAVVAAIVPGSFVIKIHVSSLEALDQLWESYKTGEMERGLEIIIVTDDLKALAPDDVEKITICISISEDDYEKARDSLITSTSKVPFSSVASTATVPSSSSSTTTTTVPLSSSAPTVPSPSSSPTTTVPSSSSVPTTTTVSSSSSATTTTVPSSSAAPTVPSSSTTTVPSSSSAPTTTVPSSSSAPTTTVPSSSSAPTTTTTVPSSSAPTTVPSSSSAPTTVPSSSSAPTTVPSSSSAPTTVPSSSSSATTVPSSSSAPTTVPSSSSAPTTVPLSSSAPTTVPSSSSAPTTVPSSSSTPTTVPSSSSAAPTKVPSSSSAPTRVTSSSSAPTTVPSSLLAPTVPSSSLEKSMKSLSIPWSHTKKWSKSISIGKSKQEDGQYTQAIRYFNKALVIARSNGSKEEEAKTLGLLADFYKSIEKFHEAVDYYEKCLSIAKDIGDKKLQWKMCYSLGDAYNKLGQYNDSMKYMKQGLVIALSTGDSGLIANSYNYLGSAYDSLYEYQKSIKCYNKAINMHKQLGDERGLGACYANLSLSYQKQGKYDAIHFREESLRIYDKIGDQQGKASSLLNLGNIHQTLNNYERAVDYYQHSLTIAKEMSHKGLQGKCYENLGSVLTKSGNYQDAISYYLEHLKIAIKMDDKEGQAVTNLNIGILYKNMNLYPEANQYFNNSLIIAKEIKEKQIEAMVYYHMGDIHFVIGEFQQVISMSENCLHVALSINDKECEGNACYLLGKAYHSLAKDSQKHEPQVSYVYMAKSEDYLKKALDCFDYLFSQLHNRDQFKISIFDKFTNTYKLLTTVYIETQQTQQALLVSDRARARALGDRLLFKYGMSKEEFLSSAPLTYPDIENVLSNDAFTLLYYSLLDESLAVWVLSKDSITFIEIDKQQFVSAVETMFGKKHEQENTINRFFTDTVAKAYEDVKIKEGLTCEKRSLDDYVHDGVTESLSRSASVDELWQESHPLEVLYNVLVAPVLSRVEHDEVVIVPDGKMYTVPFAALKDPNTGKYMSETKRIRLAPSITILKALQECPADHHSQQGALIVGNPSVGKVMFRGKETIFGDLPHAENEVSAITNLLNDKSEGSTVTPNITSLTGKQASKDVVLEKLKEQVAIIHIAAHGSSESGEIALAPITSSASVGIPEEQDYILTIKEVQQVGINAQLVVLSCCHSGRGDIQAEGMVGLSRAFLAAGARAVVASLWAIDDDVTLSFMNSFYESLCKGDSASVSLHGAMKDMRKRHSNPKDWAPFFLIGDDVTINFDDK